jgi:DNA adenine methylase
MDRNEKKFNRLTDIKKAARLIYLNKTCFNGLYRVNSKGFFNVPYGKNKNPAIYDDIVLHQISDYLNLNEITVLNNDFEQAVLTADEKSFIYFDPPYHTDKNNFTSYQANGFGESEQERLRDIIIKMTNRGIKCLLSNSDTEYIKKIYNHNSLEIIPVQAKRAINSVSDGRGAVNELLIKNYSLQ